MFAQFISASVLFHMFITLYLQTKARRAEEYEKSPTARKARYLAKKKADEAEEKMRIENNTAS